MTTTDKVDVSREAVDIPLEEIFVDPASNYCRSGGDVNYTTVADLVKAITEVGALLQPVCVVPYEKPGSKYKYKLIAGFRRHMAIKFLKWDKIPANIFTGLSEEKIVFTNISENIDRKNLNILEEAKALRYYAELGYTPLEIGKKFGRGSQWAYCRMSLLSLPDDVQRQAGAGLITQKEIMTLDKSYKKVLKGTMPKEKFDEMVRDTIDFYARMRNRNAAALTKVAKKELAEEEGRVKEKKDRTDTEVANMQGLLISLFGTSLASRAIAWSRCQISGKSFLEDVKKEAELYGLEFNIPYCYLEDHSL